MANHSSTYESLTQEIGHQLLTATQEMGAFFGSLRWDDKLLAWAMAHPGLRVQLFRFIDCLPALPNKTEIANHLQGYLSSPGVELPSALKTLLNFPQADSLAGKLAATTVTGAVSTLAQRYIAGESIPQVRKNLAKLQQAGMSFTVDLLGEAVITEAEAQGYLQNYLHLMEALGTGQVSVKLTALYSQFDPLDREGSSRKVKERARLLLRRAQELGVQVHFDMEQYAYKSLTLEILQELLSEEEFHERTDVGITLQAYLRDSAQDLHDLLAWGQQRGYPVTVRLVKGAYWDQETIHAAQQNWPAPVFAAKGTTDANFEQLTQLLLEHHHILRPAIGSHNVRSQAWALAVATLRQIPPAQIEFQVLYGMADRLAQALVRRGQQVRVYCPYGELIPGMAYLIRRLLENTANSSFLRQSLEKRPPQELLASPQASEVVAPGPQGFTNAPNTDYADPHQRLIAQEALAQVRAQLGQTYWPLIRGEYQVCGTVIESENPSQPEEIIGRVGMVGIEETEVALHAARAAFPEWRCTPVAERSRILRRAGELMECRRGQLGAWIALEVGKPLAEADAEVSEAIDFCYYYAQEMERLDRGQAADIPGETNRYTYQPRGLVAVIAPWNFPLAIPVGMTVAALVAGNCVLLKPAETSAVIGAHFAAILQEAGVPGGVFQYLPGEGSLVGAHLVRHPWVHMIVFTGSQAVGCQIYAQAAQLQPGQQHLKRVVAEMGGKNAIIVDTSADLDQAVQGVVNSAFGYSGQKCSACSRVIVLETIYERFLARLVEATRSLTVGVATNPGTRVGPVIDRAAQERIQAWIARAPHQGEVVLAMPSPAGGYFVGPVIVAGVDSQAPLAQEEIFGPVLAVLRAVTFSQALEIANGTPYALTGGLYSRTPWHIAQAQTEFAVGNLYINRTTTGAVVNRQAFGGFKLSGVGSKAGGPDYLLQFLEPRVVTENIQRQGFAPIPGTE